MGRILALMNQSNIKAVLFDFDYTLADSSRGVIQCAQGALSAMGYAVPEEEAIAATIGHPLAGTFEILTGESDEGVIAEFRRLFVARADELMVAQTRLYPDTIESLRRLYQKGFALGIVSTKYTFRIRHTLEPYELLPLFSVIMGGDGVSRVKPDPEGLHLAMAELGMEPDEVLFVGDSLIDWQAATAAEVAFVPVLNGVTSRQSFADKEVAWIASSLTELAERLTRPQGKFY